MPQTEELRVVIKSVADNSGFQQALTAQQEFANASLRQAMRAAPQTLAGFQAQVRAIESQLGARPTLGPDAFGIGQTVQAARTGTGELLRFGAIAGAAGFTVTQVLEKTARAYAESVQATREHERAIRANAAAYGEAASQYQQFAEQLSAATGFTSDAILQAALNAHTLSANYGLTIAQTQKLITISADLARVHGIGVAEAFDKVESAMRGQTDAADALGLRIDSNATTQQRYNQVVAQSAQFAGFAKNATNDLDGAFGRAETSANKLQVALGKLTEPPTVEGLKGMAKLGNDLADALDRVRGLPDQIHVDIPGIAALEGPARRQVQAQEEARQAQQQADAAAAAAAARQQQVDEARRRRLMELNDIVEPQQATDQEMRQIAFWEQLQAATRDWIILQQQSTRLQQEGVNLTAEEARIKLSLLPVQQQLAAAQRDITEQQIRAQMAALPATEALDNARAAAEHARLIFQDFGQPLARRQQALRDVVNLNMRTLPGLELAGFEANEPVRLAGQAATRVGLQGQLVDIGAQRTLAGVQGAIQGNQLSQQIVQGMVQGQREVVDQIIGQAIKDGLAQQGPMSVTVNVTHEDGRTQTYTELIEANQQAGLPPTIQQSAVRR